MPARLLRVRVPVALPEPPAELRGRAAERAGELGDFLRAEQERDDGQDDQDLGTADVHGRTSRSHSPRERERIGCGSAALVGVLRRRLRLGPGGVRLVGGGRALLESLLEVARGPAERAGELRELLRAEQERYDAEDEEPIRSK